MQRANIKGSTVQLQSFAIILLEGISHCADFIRAQNNLSSTVTTESSTCLLS
uniref:Uncharacterized protein n=1 Tax=Arundo donax TaxID=35708 RepID=A0A0A9HIM2_ARUDO